MRYTPHYEFQKTLIGLKDEGDSRMPVGINVRRCDDGSTFLHIYQGHTRICFYLDDAAARLLADQILIPPGETVLRAAVEQSSD